MKKIRTLILALGLFLCSVFSVGCNVVQAQPMKKISGTYKLTRYTTTNPYFVKNQKGEEVVETEVTDYLDEKYGLEVYLVVTGKEQGWYVFKSKEVSAYGKEITLTYTHAYGMEKLDRYEYVNYREGDSDEEVRLTVEKDGLYDKIHPICRRSENNPDHIYHQMGVDTAWTRVSDKTDLSYVNEQLGEFPINE